MTNDRDHFREMVGVGQFSFGIPPDKKISTLKQAPYLLPSALVLDV